MTKITLFLLFFCQLVFTQQSDKEKGSWDKSEYSGERSEKDIRMALLSKSFSWLSGSPADNEKLSVGKTAQFFGFVSLRYSSGRAAQRGAIGRAFYDLATVSQRNLLLKAVKEEDKTLKEWWAKRSQILRVLEAHLYTGESIKLSQLNVLAKEFGWLNSKSALFEAKAFAALEDSLTKEQWAQLSAFRKNPDLTNSGSRKKKIKSGTLSKEQSAQFEDLFAKCFTWLTGTMKDNQVIPLGQPAQFFGFVSIRHKSGHGASRGKISKEFAKILNDSQNKLVNQAVMEITPWVKKFLSTRNELLLELDKLRKKPAEFNFTTFKKLSEDLGILEIQCAVIEAQTYHKIRKTMSELQSQKMMELRSNYVLDSKQMENLSMNQRGEKVFTLCAACHSKNSQLAPDLKGIFNSPVAEKNYQYSTALKEYAKNGKWTAEKLNSFLKSPMKTIPGTKMAFQGLLNEKDRVAVIEYLKNLR